MLAKAAAFGKQSKLRKKSNGFQMLCMMCALRCEADPFIQKWKLKKVDEESIFPIYKGEDTLLIISGIGKIQAASAVSFLKGRFQIPYFAAWLNVGIGGQKKGNIGSGILAHLIWDSTTQKKYFPSVVFAPPFPLATVYSVDSVEIHYHQDGVYEMEAAGFYGACSRFALFELIHCCKIISDNEEHSVKNLDEKKVRELIEQQYNAIENLVFTLKDISNKLFSRCSFAEELPFFLSRWRFTQTQKFQLENFLQRYKACYPNSKLDISLFKECKNAKDLFNCMGKVIDKADFGVKSV